MSPNKQRARIAGVLYLFLAITGAYALMYVPSKITVRGDIAATAHNILANEFFYRTGIASHLVSSTLFVFLAMALYRLFREVNEHQASLMVALVMVQIPVNFLIGAFKITSLMILKGEVLKTYEPEQIQDMAMMFLKVYAYGILTLKIFWGLWLIPLAQLIIKSGFIPRFLGVLLIINGVAYIADSLISLLFPEYQEFVSGIIMVMISIGEPAFILWLLIKGTTGQKAIREV